jgi:hypothetical protein
MSRPPRTSWLLQLKKIAILRYATYYLVVAALYVLPTDLYELLSSFSGVMLWTRI